MFVSVRRHRIALAVSAGLAVSTLLACGSGEWEGSASLNIVTLREAESESGSGEVGWGGQLQFDGGCPRLQVGGQTWDVVFPYGSRAVERGDEQGVLLPSGQVLLAGVESTGEEVVIEDPSELDVVDEGECWNLEDGRNISYIVKVNDG